MGQLCVRKAPTPNYAHLREQTLWGHILVARVLLPVFPNVRLTSVQYDLEDFRCFLKSVTDIVEVQDFLRSNVVSASACTVFARNDDHVLTHYPAALPNCFLSVLLIDFVHGYIQVNSCVVHFAAVFSRACGVDPLDDSLQFPEFLCLFSLELLRHSHR